jgi:hypothetical protein
MEEHKIGLMENYGFELEINQLFAFNIHFEGQGEFQLQLNCEPNKTTKYKLAVPLAIDHIFVFFLF